MPILLGLWFEWENKIVAEQGLTATLMYQKKTTICDQNKHDTRKVLVATKYNFQEAKLRCRQLGGELALLTESTHQDKLRAITIGNETCSDYFWAPIVQVGK